VVADERRIATVLFADVVGFTALSEGRDPEQLKAILDRCFAQLAAAVTAYGGRVDKIVGDALVALFGAPVAHEDDAERAVRAALQMQESMQNQCFGDPAPRLNLRIGINTGEMIVGTPRSGGYTALGDAVNVASRLQTLAQPGQVVVGEATRAATRDAVRYQPLGALHARGREQPVDAWIALDAPSLPGYRPRRSRSPLVGRDPELRLVTGAMATCFARRRAHLVLVLGEAGLGKSRIAEELALTARREHGATVVGGRCVPYGDANEWWPVAEALRQACGITSSDTAERSATRCRDAVATALDLPATRPEVGRVVDGLMHLMGDESRLAEVDFTRARDEERRSVRVFFEGLAHKAPLVLVVGELHWADDTVLDTLDPLLDGLGSLPFLLIATARPELRGRWRPQAGRHNTIALTLDPLDEHAAQELLAGLLDGRPPPEVGDALLERSGGNPLFLEELASLLQEQGAETATVSALPATLRGIVAARLDTLPPDERSVLEDAAVIGRTGTVDGLYALEAHGQAADIADALHRLVVKDLLAVDAGEFAFRSDLVREVTYEILTKAERARRHFTLAEWLAARMKELNRHDQELEQVAHHLSAAAAAAVVLGPIPDVPADVAQRAVDALRRAAQRAEQRGLYQATVHLLDEAIGFIGPDPELRRDVVLARARAKTALGDLVGARTDLDAVRTSAQQAGDRQRLARAMIVEGDIEQREGRFAAAADTLNRAADEMRQLGDDAGVAEAVRRTGMALLGGGDREAAEAALREALEASRRLGLRRDEAWALQNLAWISFNQGNLTAAQQRLEESMLAFADAGDHGGLGWARGLLGWVRFQLGDIDGAETLASGVLAELDRDSDRWAHAMMGVLLANVGLWRGATEAAVDSASAALAEFDGLAETLGQLRAHVPLVRGLLALGRAEEAWVALRALQAPPEVVDPLSDQFTEHGRALIALNAAAQVGDPERGTAAAGALDLGTMGSNPEACEAAVLLALLALQAGHPAVAIERLAEVSSVDHARRATYHDRMIAFLAAGFAHHQLGDDAEEAAAFARAEEALSPTGDLLARALVHMARAVAASAAGAASAAVQLQDAQAELDELGLPAPGWTRAFACAADPAPAGSVPSGAPS